ncbi:MAG: hypothetical protein A4E28_03050 [Methanocella sp. PtaU1.Bin125]|nr:MAG: hypothetical protein A4E28_03050 [Methanocella sp. PtaU1.Bin125]
MMPACRHGELMDVVTLLPEEVEAIRLADLEDLEQEEMAQRMGVSRKTVWKDLHSARKKIADAVINGKALRVESCESTGSGECGLETAPGECAGQRCRRRQHQPDGGEE